MVGLSLIIDHGLSAYFFMHLQNSVLAIPKAQWPEGELKPFRINGNADLFGITKVT